MGRLLSTSSLVCLPFARSKALTTTTSILLRSLGDPGGVFDTLKVKCPPDRGSSECVTDRPASIFLPSSELSSSPFTYGSSRNKSIGYPNLPFKSSTIETRLSRPLRVPNPVFKTGSASDLSTPPLTPDDKSDCGDSFGVATPELGPQQPNDALDFLMTVFPHDGLAALPYARNVSISAPTLGSSFEGMVMSLPGQPRTLYVDAKNAVSVSLRESIVALLDLADELLDCSALIIVLERSSPVLGEVLHSLMYVGGTVVTKPPFTVDPAFVLVGMEI